MPRIRSIHPDVCIDMGLVEMDNPRAERTFMRLWTYCDDDGRAIDDPRLIKAAIYPRLDSMTFDEVDADICVLAQYGFIVRYTAENEKYLHVPSFSKWQKPNHRVGSKLPEPPSQVYRRDSSGSSPPKKLPGVVVVVGEGVVEGGNVPNGGSRGPKPRRATQVPDDFVVTPEMKDWANTNKIRSDITSETEQFKDYYLSNGAPRKNWLAAWRNWMRKADEYRFKNEPAYDEPVVAKGAGDLFPPGPEGERMRREFYGEEIVVLPGE